MKKIVALLILFCTVAAFAQNGRLDGEVFSRSGFPLPGATVAVCSQIAITAATESGSTVTITSTLNPTPGATATVIDVTPSGYNGSFTVLTSSGTQFTYTNPTSGLGPGTLFGAAVQTSALSTTACSPLASICLNTTDTSCTQPNPVVADGLGNYGFYVAPGKYFLQFFGSGLSTRLQPDQIVQCDPVICLTNTNFAFTGNNTHGGTETFNVAALFNSGLTSNGQVTINVSGIPPIVTNSSIPVLNMILALHPLVYSCGVTSTCANTLLSLPKIEVGSIALNNGSPSTATVNVINAFSGNFFVLCQNDTNPANTVKCPPGSGSTYTITSGTNSIVDVITYTFIGQ